MNESQQNGGKECKLQRKREQLQEIPSGVKIKNSYNMIWGSRTSPTPFSNRGEWRLDNAPQRHQKSHYPDTVRAGLPTPVEAHRQPWFAMVLAAREASWIRIWMYQVGIN